MERKQPRGRKAAVLNARLAGKRLGVSNQTIGLWISRGWLPATKMGNQWLIFESDLLKADRETLERDSYRQRWEKRRPRPQAFSG